MASAPAANPTPNVPVGSRFVMSHFKSNNAGGDERLYISVSPDGLNWTALNGGNPVWQPVGWAGFENVVRDPAIIFDSGYYWVAYTSGNYGRHASFGLLKSTDLLNWTFVGEIACAVPGATGQLTWNPSFFRDGDGIANLMECALDLNPLVPDSSATSPVFLTQYAGQDYATLRYRRLRQLAGVSYVVEASGDLQTWNPGQEVSATLMTDGSELVEVRDTVPTSSAARFLRLRVTSQP